jgi:hypothetical protein
MMGLRSGVRSDRRDLGAWSNVKMPAFSPQEIELLSIVGVALALIMSNALRPDLVALFVLLVMPLFWRL